MLFRNIGLVDENFEYRKGMYIGVRNDRIEYIGDEEPDADFGEVYDGEGKLLMPGFYNAHAHSPMSLLRGYGENLPLNEWLFEKVFPYEDHFYHDAVYWGTLLSMAESARCGIVSTSEMYFWTEDMMKAILESRLKSSFCRSISSIGCEKLEDSKSYWEMRDSYDLYDGLNDGRVKIEFGVHAEYTNTDLFMKAVAESAKEFGTRIQVHVAETKAETDGCIERHGMTPVEYMEHCGLFDVPANAAHCVWLTDSDRDILAAKGVSVSSNPVSNMKLGSGMCDVTALYNKGINVAIGTDGPSSNNSLNFFEEMKVFALTGKLRDPASMTPAQVIRSATRSGALAQGREDCGLIKEGFKADLIVVDTDTPNMRPVHDMLNNLVFSADTGNLVMTMVDGEIIYKDGEYMTMDIARIMAETEAANQRILKTL